MNLSNRDLEALQSALLELHEPRDLAGLEAAAPGIVLGLIPGDYFSWMESGYAGTEEPIRSVVLWESSLRFTPGLRQKLSALVSSHPFTEHAMKTGDWGPLRLSDFWTPRQLRASALWREVYRHVGIGRVLACAAFRGNRVGTFNVSRPLTARDFNERDRGMMRLLLPHFVQALQAAEAATARAGAEEKPLPSLGLTRREIEVGQWLARGRTNPEIASILGMRPRTVEKHVENILVKLGVENRTTAARMIAGMEFMPAKAAPSPGALGMLAAKPRPRGGGTRR